MFLLSCGCQCSVSLTHGAVVWSVVFDYGNFWSFALAFYINLFVSFGYCNSSGDPFEGKTVNEDNMYKNSERISSDKASNLPKRDVRFILLK